MKCFKGGNSLKIFFDNMIKSLNNKKIVQNNHNTEHKINLIDP